MERVNKEMFKNKPLVSVIVPIYNVRNYLIRCLESIRKQTYDNLEIILVDDGSTDGSEQIVDKYITSDTRFQGYHLKNSGVSNARNYGLKKASGEYITFIDSDDFVAREYIEHLLEAIINSQLRISVCSFHISHDIQMFEYVVEEKKQPIVVDLLKDFNYTGKYFQCYVCGVLFHYSCLDGLFFEETIFVGEDMLFFAEAIKRCGKYVYIEEKLYVYIRYEESASHGRYSEKKKTEVMAMQKLMLLYRDFPISFQRNVKARYSHVCINSLKKMKSSNFIDNEWRVYLIKEARKYLWDLCISQYSFPIKLSAVLYCTMPKIYGNIHCQLRK